MTSIDNCYHCGQPVPGGTSLSAIIDGQTRAMCCRGCQAIAQTIVANGLVEYYRSRDALPDASRTALPPIIDELRLYDHPEFQKSFVRAVEDRSDAMVRETALLLEGITCSACIWLNEQHLSRLDGVLSIIINYATRRARVRWDERRIKLSEILAAIAAIGYRAYPYDTARSEELAQRERRTALWRLFVAGFGMMQVMMYAVPVYMAESGEMTGEIEQLMRWASLILTFPVVAYSAGPFFGNAWRDLCLRRVSMDLPVALGVGAAFLASVWATITATGEVYFDSVTMFIFFLLGGRFLEMTARQRAVSVTESLAKLVPAVATRVSGDPTNRQIEQVMTTDLSPGDLVLVRSGETVPADGRVIEGESSADEALLTGESSPVRKFPGTEVTGGSLNVESPLLVEVTEVGESTRLSAILRLMDRAAAEKPRIVELADRIASRFIVALLLLSASAAGMWLVIDPQKALWVTVSVLVVSCPCALSLATPVALTVASGAMARTGLLITRSHAIETLARASHFVFDKTGTLTRGHMQLLAVHPLGALDAQQCLLLAAALEQFSDHPVGAALRTACRDNELPPVDAVTYQPGQGISAIFRGARIRLGRPDFVHALSGTEPPSLVAKGMTSGDTVVALASETQWLALFQLGDEIRPEARALLHAIACGGRRLTLLTGDSLAAAQRVAETLDISDVIAQASPQSKREYVQHLQDAGSIVAMIGDGVNDAPVLAQAQVSVAMGGGAQLAHSQADLVLLSGNLDHLRIGLLLAAKTLRILRQNLLWSFAYNMIALPLAMAGFVSPWMAGIGMSASSLLVVANSLRLQRPERGSP